MNGKGVNEMKEQIFTITSETGVHARPATLLVNKAGQYQSDLEIVYNEKKVNLKSIMGVMSLGIPQGSKIKVIADGKDEEAAIQGIEDVIKEHLGE